MASFDDSLRALSRGKLSLEKFLASLERVLEKAPEVTSDLISRLDVAYNQSLITADQYSAIKKSVRAVTANQPARSDATMFEAISDRPDTFSNTGGINTTGLDIDLSVNNPGSMSWPTGGSSPSGGSWTPPTGGTGGPTAKLEPGSVLKERFILDEILGVGGMGTVFKGRDLRKVEVEDKNPYVALKVLNEDFKRHPDSFIALAREASRQQKLAHPNIATVYDFDRAGDTVFMSMELLVGTPLNNFIRESVKGRKGLPMTEAFPIIKGLGAALTYAHERKIVHSDFKPGNCFLLESGQVKVLDFGIARAVKNPGQGEGDKTLFDPKKLGALTPAYASAEMLDGDDPEPRDDIYALACVAYELLTGQHPFNKMPANKARDNKLVPAPVKALSRRQSRGLTRGLAFARKDRSKDVETFLKDLSGEVHPLRNPWVVGGIATAVVLLIGLGPLMTWWHNQQVMAITTELMSGDPARIETGLTSELPDLGDDDRKRVLENAKDAVIMYFEKRIGESVSVAGGKLDFPKAEALVGQAMALYPDSAKLNQVIATLADVKNQIVARLTGDFNQVLESGALLPGDGLDLGDVLAELAVIVPDSPLLTDRRLPGAFAREAEKARDVGDFALAGTLIEAGLARAPKDIALINLSDSLRAAIEAQDRNAEIAERVSRLQAKLAGLGNGASLLEVKDDLLRLASLEPNHPLLSQIREQASPVLAAEIESLLNEKALGRGEGLLSGLGRLFELLGLGALERRLTDATESYAQQADALLEQLINALAEDRIGSDGAAGLLDQLRNLAPAGPRVDEAQVALAGAYLAKSRTARQQGDASGAADWLSQAEAFVANDPRLERERAALAAPPASAEVDSAASKLADAIATVSPELAQVASLVTAWDDWARLGTADPRYQDLNAQASSKLRDLATELAGKDRWAESLAVARAAWVQFPHVADLATAFRNGLSGEREAHARLLAERVKQSQAELQILAANPIFDFGWDAAVSEAIERLREVLPKDDPTLSLALQQVSALYLAKASEMRAAQRFSESKGLLDRASRVAGEPAVAAERAALAAAETEFQRQAEADAKLASIEADKQTLLALAMAKDVVSAEKTYAALLLALPADDPFLTGDAATALGDAYASLAMVKKEEGDYGAALALAEKGLSVAPRSEVLVKAVKDYSAEGTASQLIKRFSSASTINIEDVRKQLTSVQAGVDPERFQAIETSLAETVAKRLLALREAEPAAHNSLLESAKQVLGTHPTLNELEPVIVPSLFAPVVTELLKVAKLTEARAKLTEAQKTEAENPEIVALTQTLTTQERAAADFYTKYLAAFGREEFASAKDFISEAEKLWADNGEYANAKKVVVAKLNTQAPSTGTDAGPEALPPPGVFASKQPCTAKLAGYGKRKQGTCFDMLDPQARAPSMVVIPAGDGVDKPFAIAKYELPVSDYNNYCLLTKACEPLNINKKLPMTKLSVADAEAYAAWLSKTTGQRYRLPTSTEWARAASAKGSSDYNCRLSQGGKIIKGTDVIDVNSGKPNDFGLYNAIGNVQELVQGGVARGGAYTDSVGKCNAEMEKQVGADGDETTGVRLVRELGQG